MTHIRDNDTSIRFALNTIKTEGVPAVCEAKSFYEALKGQATLLWGYDAVLTAAQNIPLCRGAWQIRQDDVI